MMCLCLGAKASFSYVCLQLFVFVYVSLLQFRDFSSRSLSVDHIDVNIGRAFSQY